MAAKGIQFPWRWNDSTISPNLEVIWEMSGGVSEWRKIWPNGLPDEGQSPKPGHRMAARHHFVFDLLPLAQARKACLLHTAEI